uniref:Uncharacterized protein n=1 Tax=Anguilla anguilla TaxID=7936 RepID=A0A0E9VPW8_ANGAN
MFGAKRRYLVRVTAFKPKVLICEPVRFN